MIRIAVVVLACTALVWIGISIWFAADGGRQAERAGESLDGPRQFDTTGGQEMRPRWGDGEGQGDEATEN
ncbi:DUF2749 domain-containing protein [Neoaquamicrobium sediminum]|uniref:DUF2749 domain-containing protein n=1 Tax=Neoaquamicrobium sediminum TaxID=1849104 RepID=UPI0015664726|nr:DUF2749 domain-containing protein [Mesorhizobium sediminum]NRC57197.1 DUF2749 domain-containing protein [Mesorhizobium sediminum]